VTEHEELDPRIKEAIWAGDVETLDELARCVCCCSEHTHLGCPARVWNGCRSGLEPGEEPYDEKGWVAHYAKHHGMTEEDFYGEEEP
jgi:hypothetical protein